MKQKMNTQKLFSGVLVLMLAFMLFACNSKRRSQEVAGYQYTPKSTELNQQLQAKVGNWIKEGTVCYGLIVVIENEKLRFGKPVKARVLKISGDNIKMKALEKVSVGAAEKGCSKMGISKGETWLEKDGELFQTKEEAIKYLTKLLSKKQ